MSGTPLMPTLRRSVFTGVIVSSAIILALSAHVTNTTIKILGVYFTFAALGIATSLLALLSLPVMLVVDNMRKGAFTSMIAVELGWLGLLWVLFLSTASTASQAAMFEFGSRCLRTTSSLVNTTCREFSAIQAFAYLSWISLFGYFCALLRLSTQASNRGYDRVWYQSVKETEFNAPPVQKAPVPAQTQQYMPAQNTGYSQAGAYPPQATPAPGWAGQPQQAPGVSYPVV